MIFNPESVGEENKKGERENGTFGSEKYIRKKYQEKGERKPKQMYRNFKTFSKIQPLFVSNNNNKSEEIVEKKRQTITIQQEIV